MWNQRSVDIWSVGSKYSGWQGPETILESPDKNYVRTLSCEQQAQNQGFQFRLASPLSPSRPTVHYQDTASILHPIHRWSQACTPLRWTFLRQLQRRGPSQDNLSRRVLQPAALGCEGRLRCPHKHMRSATAAHPCRRRFCFVSATFFCCSSRVFFSSDYVAQVVTCTAELNAREAAEGV